MIYFDNAASTKPLDSVMDTYAKVSMEMYANPASMSILGLVADKEIRRAAESISNALSCDKAQIYFTSGGTEGDNWAIFGTAKGYKRRGKHLITTQTEHPAVRNSMKQLEELGYEVTWLKVDKNGLIDLNELKSSIRQDTILVSIILINNETGTIQDIEKIGKIIKNKNKEILFHVDAVQAFGKYPINIEKMNIDLLTMSGHKIHGPKGVGALYMREGLKVRSLIIGGAQQQEKRAGTENTAGVAALGNAVDECVKNMIQTTKNVREIKKILMDGILSEIPDTSLNGEDIDNASPYVLNISFLGVRSEVLLHALEGKGIFVSAGSACDSKKKIGSPVLTAMGLPFEEIEGAIRFSFSRQNTMDEARMVLVELKQIVGDLRKYTQKKK